MREPKFRRDLNALQKDILLALYKFRFASVELLVKYQGLKSVKYTYARLKILLDQEYIGRRFSKQDKIDRKAATYYLLPKGLRVLKAEPELNQKPLTNMYKDRNASQTFLDRSLLTFRFYNKFHELYGKTLTFYSKTEMSEYDFFPKPLPDGYMSIGGNNYLLETFPALTPPIGLRRSIERFTRHFESDDWDEAGTDYPIILLVCETAYLERQAQKLATRLLYNNDIDDMTFYTTTTKALLGSQNSSELIWSDVEDPEDLISLT